MDEAFIGSIVLFAGNYAPNNWAFCNGQLLSISQNTALFSVIGTTYGGDGQTTFALPDLRGRVPMHFGNGPGLTPRSLGEKAGTENVTLTAAQMPAHNHEVVSVLHANEEANSEDPTNRFNAGTSNPTYNSTTNIVMNSAAVTNTVSVAGQSAPHSNMPPYLGLNFIICLYGIYPPRS
jgi:microcystin-dependent protein